MKGKQNVPPPMSNAAFLESSKLFCYLNLVSIWDWTIFFCKAFKCVFCLVEYIHHCTETVVLTLKAVFLRGWAYSKVPVHVKSCVPGLVWFFFFLFGYEAGKKKVRKEGMHVGMFVFLQEKGIGRLNWFLFPIKDGEWREKGIVRESAWKKNTLNKASLKCV